MNLLDDDPFALNTQPNGEECPGVYFRYTENNYFVKGKLVFQKQLSLLKKKSCPGCEKCGWVLDDVQNGVDDFGADFFEFPDNLNHGDIVELTLVIDSRDWETGYVDTYHLRVDKVSADITFS